MFCLKDKYEAKEFVHQNITDWDLLTAIHAKSIGDAYKKITSHEMDKAASENFKHSVMTKGRNEEELRKEKKATPANDASQSKLKTKPNNTLQPKKSKNNQKGLHFS